MKRTLNDKSEGWEERITETVQNVAERARNISERAKHLGKAADEYVHENIWTTVAVAAAVGCAVGYCLARRGD